MAQVQSIGLYRCFVGLSPCHNCSIGGPRLGSNDLAVDSSDDDGSTKGQVETCKTPKAQAQGCCLVFLSTHLWPMQVTWPNLKPRDGKEHPSMAGLWAQAKNRADNVIYYHGHDHGSRPP